VIEMVVRVDHPADRSGGHSPDRRQQLLGGRRRNEAVHDQDRGRPDHETGVADRSAAAFAGHRCEHSFTGRDESEVLRRGRLRWKRLREGEEEEEAAGPFHSEHDSAKLLIPD
jgi:hypothetical protein